MFVLHLTLYDTAIDIEDRFLFPIMSIGFDSPERLND
jgi:hypothetical protein